MGLCDLKADWDIFWGRFFSQCCYCGWGYHLHKVVLGKAGLLFLSFFEKLFLKAVVLDYGSLHAMHTGLIS